MLLAQWTRTSLDKPNHHQQPIFQNVPNYNPTYIVSTGPDLTGGSWLGGRGWQEWRYKSICLGVGAPISAHHVLSLYDLTAGWYSGIVQCRLRDAGLIVTRGSAAHRTDRTRSVVVRFGYMATLLTIHVSPRSLQPTHIAYGSSCATFSQKVVVKSWLSSKRCQDVNDIMRCLTPQAKDTPMLLWWTLTDMPFLLPQSSIFSFSFKHCHRSVFWLSLTRHQFGINLVPCFVEPTGRRASNSQNLTGKVKTRKGLFGHHPTYTIPIKKLLEPEGKDLVVQSFSRSW